MNLKTGGILACVVAALAGCAQAQAPAGMGMMAGHKKPMHEAMVRIHQEKDPAERQRLMEEHKKAMMGGRAAPGTGDEHSAH